MIDPSFIIIGGVLIVGIWAIVKLQQNFTMKLFYKIGMWLFVVQGLANSYGLYIDYPVLPIWALVTRAGSLLFTYLLTYLFYFLDKTAPASLGGEGTQLSPEEINDYLKEDLKKENDLYEGDGNI